MHVNNLHWQPLPWDSLQLSSTSHLLDLKIYFNYVNSNFVFNCLNFNVPPVFESSVSIILEIFVYKKNLFEVMEVVSNKICYSYYFDYNY